MFDPNVFEVHPRHRVAEGDQSPARSRRIRVFHIAINSSIDSMDQAWADRRDDTFVPFRIDSFRQILSKQTAKGAIHAVIGEFADASVENLEFVPAHRIVRQLACAVMDAGIPAPRPKAKAQFKILHFTTAPKK